MILVSFSRSRKQPGNPPSQPASLTHPVYIQLGKEQGVSVEAAGLGGGFLYTKSKSKTFWSCQTSPCLHTLGKPVCRERDSPQERRKTMCCTQKPGHETRLPAGFIAVNQGTSPLNIGLKGHEQALLESQKPERGLNSQLVSPLPIRSKARFKLGKRKECTRICWLSTIMIKG